jgi:hypothetical protein
VGTPVDYKRVLSESLRREKTFAAMVQTLSDEKLIPLSDSVVERAREMRRYLDQLSKEMVVAVYADRAYAFAGIK